MTTQELLDFFDILQDKYGTPYFTEDEKLLFLNNATIEYLNSLFPTREDQREDTDVEINWNALQDISPLIFTASDLLMSSSGIISRADLNTAIQNVSGDGDAEVFKILSVEMRKSGNRFPIRSMRHNDKLAFETNYFKKPTVDYPRYTLENNNLQFRPTDQIGRVAVTVVKTPKRLSIDPVVDPELPSSVHNQLVAIGLEFAGIASRDDVLKAMLAMKQP